MHFLDAFYSTNVKRILPTTWTSHPTMRRLIPIGWPCSVPTIPRKDEIRSSLQILHRLKALELTLLVAVTRDLKQVRGRWRWHRWLPIETLLLCSPWRPVPLVTASLYRDMKMIQIKIITSVNIEQLFNFFFLKFKQFIIIYLFLSESIDSITRATTQKPRYCHILLVLIDLHWLPVCQRIEFKIATTAYKVLHYQQPSHIAEIMIFLSIHQRSKFCKFKLTIRTALMISSSNILCIRFQTMLWMFCQKSLWKGLKIWSDPGMILLIQMVGWTICSTSWDDIADPNVGWNVCSTLQCYWPVIWWCMLFNCCLHLLQETIQQWMILLRLTTKRWKIFWRTDFQATITQVTVHPVSCFISSEISTINIYNYILFIIKLYFIYKSELKTRLFIIHCNGKTLRIKYSKKWIVTFHLISNESCYELCCWNSVHWSNTNKLR